MEQYKKWKDPSQMLSCSPKWREKYPNQSITFVTIMYGQDNVQNT